MSSRVEGEAESGQAACCELGELERTREQDERRTRAASCPASGHTGVAVEWMTIAALLRVPLPPKATYWLCPDPACPVVYFSAAGARFERDTLHVDPGFKRARGDGLVCYCFGHLESDVIDEIESTGSSTVIEAIRARIRSAGCACEVRNPSGRCCLREITRLVRAELARREARR
jgi:hypothetical protein